MLAGIGCCGESDAHSGAWWPGAAWPRGAASGDATGGEPVPCPVYGDFGRKRRRLDAALNAPFWAGRAVGRAGGVPSGTGTARAVPEHPSEHGASTGTERSRPITPEPPAKTVPMALELYFSGLEGDPHAARSYSWISPP